MNNWPEADFYCIGEKDFITTTSIEEAVQEWYDGCDEQLEQVEVQAYNKKQVLPEDSKLPKWWLEYIIENLDENYGCEEIWGDYSPSTEAMEYFNKFVDCIRKEYVVTQLEEVGKPFIVNVKEVLGD